ncbi:MAG: DUF4296 domain-containing protein [Bacteroidaceae bacterium]|nr:DUF4296 domain-containing protein [Bacteroidaceae bacterium]
MKRFFPFILLFALIIVACEDRPKNVLSRSEMENVLYDYHMMQGIINQLPSEERMEKAQDYINAVFEKHGITEAQFDTSIIYYNRHAEDLHEIYKNLKERYNSANEEIQIVNGNNDMMAIYETGGDTTNLWSSAQLYAFHNKSLLNKESFTIHADSSFYKNDQLILTLTPIFIRESRDDYDISLNVGLSVMYTDGRHIGTTRTITNSGTQQLTVKTDAQKELKSITGFFYYRGKKSTRNLCIVDNISLVRMHEKAPEVEISADSIKADSIVEDTVVQPIERRLTPEEIRQQNKSGEHITIQTAPSVRTPNSIGPRRRKATTPKR